MVLFFYGGIYMMRFCTTEEKPVDIEIVSGGEKHHIKFYPTDLLTRERFYQTYENLKNYKLKEIVPTVDKNGVSSAELENTKELHRFTDFLGEQIDGIFGAGTAKLITNGRCNPVELIRFMCETAHYFTQTSSDLIKHYTNAIGDGVMK